MKADIAATPQLAIDTSRDFRIHTVCLQPSPTFPMKIAVIGAGPSGNVCAALLAKRGHDVAVFDECKRPDLIVGESLVPGVIPLLRRLGIEEKVAAIGVKKPGVTFFPALGKNLILAFPHSQANFRPTLTMSPDQHLIILSKNALQVRELNGFFIRPKLWLMAIH